MKQKGKLYLIPNTLGDSDLSVLPAYVAETAQKLDYFIVENLRNARRYLVKLGIKKHGKIIDDLTFYHLDKHLKSHEFQHFLEAAENGHDIGLLSDAGCPAVADPGAVIVELAHQKNIEVVPLVGPSSILLSLMASGLNGQSFAFSGYLPINKSERSKQIQFLDKICQRQTQIFIETPYRNPHLFKDLLQHCKPQTPLCVAWNISLENQFIRTKTIQEWKKTPEPDIHKKPCIFLLGK